MIKSYFKKISGKQSKKSTSYLDLPFFNYSQDERVGVDSYKNNAIVHRCVNLIATSASHIPWQIFRNNNGSKELLKNHPILSLLKYPSPEKSGADFFTESLSSLLLYGDSYLLISSGNKTTPSFLYNLHPSLVEQTISNNQLVSYVYGNGDKRQSFGVDPVTRKSRVLHLKNYNPTAYLLWQRLQKQ